MLAASPTEHALVVAYGTSQKTDKIYLGEFIIPTTDPDFDLTGLAYDTKFNLNHRLKLYYTSEWFNVAPPRRSFPAPVSPRMGILPASYYDVVRKAAEHIKYT
ncbi:hypothetical protein [Photorhabdus cinerea]|uniref:hypothetical protein n=1 Tax=Photorhabdus cinerea TaxID=471575 RepID=UPI001F6189FC|nr:hypothetical protein [Photorhabdus cinerea]